MRLRPTLIALLAVGAVLGGCHKHREQPTENEPTEAPAALPEAPKPAPTPAPAPKPAAKPDAPKPKPAPKATADEQMIDDADATGMTSHASRNAETSSDAPDNSPN